MTSCENKECVKYWCSMRINPDLKKLVAHGGRKGKKFQRDQINSLRNGKDSDLKQSEKAFKDFSDGFSEKNSSESIVGNSEVY